MKKLIPLLILISALACQDEQSIDVATSGTFIRYFGSESNETALLAEETHGGYALLSNVDVSVDRFGHYINQIQLTRLDVFGNLIAKPSRFPATADLQDEFAGKELFGGQSAKTFISIDNGYLIIGDSINTEGKTKILILEVNTQGEYVRHMLLPQEGDGDDNPTVSYSGRAVAKTKDGSGYIILGTISGAPDGNDMYLAEVSTNLQTRVWRQKYGQGDSTPAKKLFITQTGDILWGSTVRKLAQAGSDIRMIQTKGNNSLPDYNNFVGNDGEDETISEFFVEGANYVMIGSRNTDNQDNDMYFARMSVSNGKTLIHADKTITMADLELNEVGVSICAGHNGGYVLLGNMESGTVGLGRDDFYVVRIDAFGNIKWSHNYGTSDQDEAASIRQTSDGGYLLYGATTFGSPGIKKPMLIKLNKDGKF